MKIHRCFWLFFIGLISIAFGQKMNGVSYVGTKENILPAHITPVEKLGANYVSLMPFGYLDSIEDSKVRFDTSWQWKGETTAGIEAMIPLFQAVNIQVMLKPQIWISKGVYTGKINPPNEHDWQELKSSYRDFILHFAQLAEKFQLPLYCIGTELSSMVKKDPQFWRDLIQAVRKVYRGKLVYAENWDQYEVVTFWDALDYIGVNAYFPLKGPLPATLDSIDKRWSTASSSMAQLSQQMDRPILFTEMGYRSIPDPLSRPWDYRTAASHYDPQMQAMAMEALLRHFMPKKWWKGGFVWKWFPNHEKAGGEMHTGFSPQNKLAEDVLRRYFTKRE